MKETALNIFKELGISIDTSDIEACHHVGPPSRRKKIVKMSRRKNAGRVQQVKKGLKDMKLESLEVESYFY